MTKIVSKLDQLREPCEDVGIEEGLKIADKLIDILQERGDGIGLAANQIAIQKKVCVIAVPQRSDNGELVTWCRRFLNPRITDRTDPFILTDEGCLSFEGERVKTLRYRRCTVIDSLNPNGLQVEGLEAIVCQHETDHLNQLTMHDRKIKNYGSNDKCPCGSELKFKKCCWRQLQKSAVNNLSIADLV